MSAMAILQQVSSRDYNCSTMLPSRKWRLVLFAMAFLWPSNRCLAGPISKSMCRPDFAFPQEFPVPKDLFPRSVAIPASPRTIFLLDTVDRTHIIVPPEFRMHDSRAANATAEMPQAPRRDVDWFCGVGYHLPPYF